MPFSYLRGNCMFSHQTKGISDCFPCGTLGISKPVTQHLMLATFIAISMEIMVNRTEFVIFQIQFDPKQMPIHNRIQRI